ncbi:MAG: hypothetical protein Q7T74_00570 [Candidatus Saccharibacteria bacterium]|nr:hypothetical protein [Candidatus Saccharibacteria bacterium]
MREIQRLPIVESDSVEEIEGPAIVISRHQRSAPMNESSFGTKKQTRVTGIDKAGNIVAERGFFERTSRAGVAWQGLMETWKVKRVKVAVGISAVKTTLSEFFDQEMESKL